MLVGQARAEAARHEQKRAAGDREARRRPIPRPTLAEVDRGLRHARHADQARGPDGGPGRRPRGQAQGAGAPPRRARGARGPARGRAIRCAAIAAAPTAPPATSALPPSLSRVVLSAQEDLRREIARSMHDGPAQSLTNIVLQAQIVERLVGPRRRRWPGASSGCSSRWSSRRSTRPRTSSSTSGRWCSTTSGLVPTLRRVDPRARPPGARARGVRVAGRGPAAADGHREHRVPDPGRGAGRLPRRSARSGSLLRLDWGDELEAHLSAHRTPASVGDEPLPAVPTGRRPRRDQADDPGPPRRPRRRRVAAAKEAAIVVLPAGGAAATSWSGPGRSGRSVEIDGGRRRAAT